MQRRYVTIDVFTDQPFGGNPLAVVLDADGLSTAQMQALAREFAYSETSFVLPPAEPSHAARVRIFTPGAEIPFAGHPNIGTAVVLARRASGAASSRLVFEETAGLVPVDILSVGGVVVGAELTAPTPLSRGGDLPAARLARAVGLAAADIAMAAHPPTLASVGLPFVFAELATREALRRAMPDVSLLSAALTDALAAGVLLYARDGSDASCDVHARMFSPLDGIGEDPATGSANAALAALLAALDPARDSDLVVRVAQGVDMGRPSRLRARAVKRDGTVVSAHVGGQAVEMMQGFFRLTAAP